MFTTNEKLKTVVDSIDFYQSTFPEDTVILVFDTEKVVAYKPGKTIDSYSTLTDLGRYLLELSDVRKDA